ncbi:MAG TPA: carboxypeptidase regulatory-like domain-containing protein [Terriglobales bacterium]|jgi:Carboxypeptidase regulatory-like domain/TonB-dependent Receptor Plug Domain/TonB dependent receptor|nr:carboxypeptidase regulatory-like domain-containing protein [Terriglobales bacterium]
MQNSKFKLLVRVALFASLLFACSLFAQSFRGLIRGKVADPTGSLIAGAKVTARSSATGLVRETVTGSDGGYVLAELPVGTYTVTAEAAGLTPTAQNVVVNVGSDTTADFDLSMIQRRQEQLTVEASAPIVDAGRDVLGEVVERKLVVELPLNGRDFGKLVALTPGTTVDPSGVAGTQGGFGQFNINGNRDRSNNYTLDGTDNNDPFFNNSALNQTGIGGAPASLLPVDAIQEFNLQSHFPAEYGRNSGSVVNIITRSGTNQWHGSAFEFLRNSALDARNYFNTQSRKSVFQNNSFGASIGGAIIHDRTFFFGAYEGQRERVGSDFLLQVPTNTQRESAREIATTLLEQPVNPSLDAILAIYPSSDSPTIPGVVHDKNDGNNFIVKIDHAISSTEQITGRYAFAQSDQVFPFGSPGGFGTGSRLAQFAQTSPARVQVISGSLLSTLGATKINEVRFGYSRYRTSFSSLNATFDPESIGLNFGTGKLGLPEFDFTNIENLGAIGFSVPRGRTSQTYQLLDNFTWVKGKHTLKFGGEFRRAAIENFNDNIERGIFQFSAGNGFSADPVVDSLVNFYTGGAFDENFDFFVLAATGDTHRTTYNNGFSVFAQDDYRLTPTFTLNLGLRWEYFGPMSEKNDLLSNLATDGTLAMVGTHGLDGLYERDLRDFAPRVGFAWNVLSDTVVRAGYGIYHDYVPQHLFIANFTSSAGVATNPIGPKPVLPLDFDPAAFNGTSPNQSENPPILTPNTTGPYSIFVTPRKFHSPYTQNWNVNVQQKFAQNASVEIGYVGSKGTKLVRLTDLNEPDGDGNAPNPNFGTMDLLTPAASSIYHGLQSTIRIQNAHHLSGFASYNWSKTLDDASDGIDFAPGVAFPQDPSNLRAERGPSSFDTKHRFTAAVNYSLPSWTALKKLGSGWQLNWIASVQSGRPIPIVTASDTSGRFYFNQRPNVVPGVDPIVHNWTPATGYLNPAAFIQPAFGSFGNLGRNSVYGPGYKNLDFSITKNTEVREHVSLQFRAEFFNILNHPNFAQPNHNVIPAFVDNGSPGNPDVQPDPGAPTVAGLITQTPDVAQTNPGLGGGGPRVVQLGLKLIF